MKPRKLGVWDAEDCALIFIDYQPEMFKNVRSSDPSLIELNACALARTAVKFKIPVVLSTVGVEMGVNHPTVESLRGELPESPEIDRSSMNAWEDKEFLRAIKDTGKKRLIFCALYTEICLAYPVISALQDGYDVMFVTDAVGGQSYVEHETAVLRLIQVGAIPNTTSATICEWFRDWKAPLATQGRENLKWYWNEKRAFLKSVSADKNPPVSSAKEEPRAH